MPAAHRVAEPPSRGHVLAYRRLAGLTGRGIGVTGATTGPTTESAGVFGSRVRDKPGPVATAVLFPRNVRPLRRRFARRARAAAACPRAGRAVGRSRVAAQRRS